MIFYKRLLNRILKLLTRFFYISFIVVFSTFGKAQNTFDKLIITKNTYIGSAFLNDVSEKDFSKESVTIRNRREIQNIFEQITKFNNPQNLLADFGIDTLKVKNNPNEILKMVDTKRPKVEWIDKQVEYILPKLSNTKNFKEKLNDYLREGDFYSMHNSYKYQYNFEFYKDKVLEKTFNSRKTVYGFKFPYSDGENLSYNIEVDRVLDKIFKNKGKAKKLLTGNDLLKYLANNIVESNINELYKLAPYKYIEEINELKTDFEILEFEEIYTIGRYNGDNLPLIAISLKNNLMFPNVTIRYYASVQNKKLFPSDSLEKDYKDILERFQNDNFISDYLNKNENSKLNVYYFDDKGINNYNIKSINQDEKSWEKFDAYEKNLRIWHETSPSKDTFDLEKAIETSKFLDCGCNYRFKKDFVERAIFFEIKDDEKNSSIWFLLPDNSFLLYIMDNERVLGFSRNDLNLREGNGLIFPCLLFSKEGKLIKNN